MLANWLDLTQAERDAAYNNNAAVADSPALIARRNAAAKAYRAAHPGGLNTAYGDEPRRKWDFFPADATDAPCLVFIHGGYWQRNAREDFSHLAAGIRSHGWSVAMPGYTLAPETGVSGIVGELRQALDWLAEHGPTRGVAGGDIIVSGWSAGGHLAAMLLDHPAVVSGLAVSGVYELGPLRDTGLNAALSLTDEEIADMSPLRLPVIAKPLTIAFGTRELPALVNDSEALHRRRSDAGAPSPLLPIDGADHFTILDDLELSDGRLVQALLQSRRC